MVTDIFFHFLYTQLYDQESEIVQTALDILEESCEDEVRLRLLIVFESTCLKECHRFR